MIDLRPYFIVLSGKYLRKEDVCVYMCEVYPKSKIWLATKNRQKYIFKSFYGPLHSTRINYFAT